MASVLRSMRQLMPDRPVTIIEAEQVAVRQATLLLKLSGVTAPPVPEEIVTALPRFEVERRCPFPTSGLTVWREGHWLIVINGGEPLTRQRFTLLHEFRHAVDHPYAMRAYVGRRGLSAHELRERICDVFAANVLMPKPWVVKAWTSGIQDVRELAQCFDISKQAMQIRLDTLGLSLASDKAPYYRRPMEVAA